MAKTKTPKSTQPGTTVAKTAIVSLVGLTATGKLKTVRKGSSDKPAAFRTICPECLPAGVPIIQQYTCPSGHGPFSQADCPKGKEVDGVIVPFNEDQVDAIRGTTDEAPEHVQLDLHVHPADQVAPYVRPTGITYYFEPGPGASTLVGILRDLASEPDLAFVSEGLVKGVRRWFLIRPAPHGIEFAEMARPETVFDFEPQELPYEQRFLDMALQLVEAVTEDFDPERYHDGAAERLAEVLATMEDTGATVTALPTTTATTASGLESALAASLAAARARKAA